MPSKTGVAHDAMGLGDFSISTKHIRQLPAMERRGAFIVRDVSVLQKKLQGRRYLGPLVVENKWKFQHMWNILCLQSFQGI